MAIQREITVKLANSPGTLSRVSQLLGAERINMLAMAIEQKPEAIGIWGVDMSADEEYSHQRPGCHYFIQRAQELGITTDFKR